MVREPVAWWCGSARVQEASAVHKETKELVRPPAALSGRSSTAIPGGVVLVFDHELRFWIAEGEGFVAQGWDTDDVERLRLGDVTPPERATFLEPFYRATLAGEPQSSRSEGRKDARIFWVQVFPLATTRGVVIAGCVLGQDVTESREAQEALEVAERRMAAGGNISPTGMALCGGRRSLHRSQRGTGHDVAVPTCGADRIGVQPFHASR